MNMRQSRGAEYRKGSKFQAQRTRRSVSDNIFARECQLTESGNGVFKGIRAEISEKVQKIVPCQEGSSGGSVCAAASFRVTLGAWRAYWSWEAFIGNVLGG